MSMIFKNEEYFEPANNITRVVVHVSADRQMATLATDHSVQNPSSAGKPERFRFAEINQNVASGKWIKRANYQFPVDVKKTDRQLKREKKERWLKKRDKKVKFVKEIIRSNELIEQYLYEPEGIGMEVTIMLAKSNYKQVNSIYRLVNQFITFGCNINAFLPWKLRHCGTNPIEIEDENTSHKKRGPKEKVRSKARSVTKKDKRNLSKVIKWVKKQQEDGAVNISIAYCFKIFQKHFESYEIIRESSYGIDKIYQLKPEEERISKSQFYYHFKRLVSKDQWLEFKVGAISFEKDHQTKTGLARDGVVGPSYRYEVDATVLDLYLRYPFDPEERLSAGRPVLYLVIDVWSTCIVGMYLGFHGPDWSGASEALFNACVDKVEFAKQFGLELEPGDWDCHHTPIEITMDNGSEYSLINFGSVLNAAIGIQTGNFVACFRGDCKSIVERKFGVLKDAFVKYEPGALYEIPRKEDQHVSNQAVWEYKSLMRTLIRLIIHQNKTANRLKLHNFHLAKIKADISPQSIYTECLTQEMNGGRVVDPVDLRFAFLREQTATVTDTCIEFEGLEYTSDFAKSAGWHRKAKRDGRYQITVRYTSTNASTIWCRVDGETILTLRLRDPDSWAHAQRFEDVRCKIEEGRQQLHDKAQERYEKEMQLAYEIDREREINRISMAGIPFNLRKGLSKKIKAAKDIEATLNKQAIYKNIADILIQLDPSQLKTVAANNQSNQQYDEAEGL